MSVGHVRYRLSQSKRHRHAISTSVIDPEFAERMNVLQRLQHLDRYVPDPMTLTSAEERAAILNSPFVAAGLERYGRVASAVGIEARNPFMDRDVVTFCLSLPCEQLLANGWTKMIVRRAMDGLLPDEVRWRSQKTHLGGEFNAAVFNSARDAFSNCLTSMRSKLEPYIKREVLDEARQLATGAIDPTQSRDFIEVYNVFHMGNWLRLHRVP